ncbi:hypothetical protein VNI00_014728 [Paramarasmius palmivorus]|uniref:HMG box domain-containing protein n=1 Tax=Paramarasmius palmivorus TaxID=297713 RepID=A0AAW0BQ59_9AGAR
MYRSYCIQNRLIPPTLETDSAIVTRIIAQSWRLLPAVEKQYWRNKAKEERILHAIKYPNYRFRPQTKNRGTRRQKKSKPSSQRQTDIAKLLANGRKGAELSKEKRHSLVTHSQPSSSMGATQLYGPAAVVQTREDFEWDQIVDYLLKHFSNDIPARQILVHLRRAYFLALPVCMRTGKDDTGIIALSKRVVALHEAAGTIPWIRAFFDYLPLGSSNLKSHMNFAKQTILNRIERGPSSTRDLFSYLLGEYEDDPRLDTPTLIAEAVFAIIAGSDTTAAALSNVFFFLVSSTKVFHRLRTELDELNCHTDATAAELANLPYLNAVINESLRLQPLAPNGLQRVLTNENGAGEMVNGYYIPPMTNVQVSHYCIHHDPEYWSPYPDRFWPERWLANATEFMTEPERQHYRMGQEIAFFPFSHGPTACAGKALALMEMRTVIAAIVANFDIAFEPGWDTREWERDLKDFFILRVGRLPVVFTARK